MEELGEQPAPLHSPSTSESASVAAVLAGIAADWKYSLGLSVTGRTLHAKIKSPLPLFPSSLPPFLPSLRGF